MTSSLSEREKNDYYNAIMEVPDIELDWLIGALLHSRAKRKREAAAIEFKICDNCQLTYPFYTISCRRCLNESLRVFSVRHSHKEILDCTGRMERNKR